MNKLLAILSLYFITSFSLLAQENLTVIAVGQATVEKTKLAIVASESGLAQAKKSKIQDVLNIIANDFAFYKKQFEVANKEVSNNTTPSNWSNRGIDFLLVLTAHSSSDAVDVNVFSVKDSKKLASKTSSLGNIRALAHDLADAAYVAMTGNVSIFKTKILFVSDRGSRGRDISKELYIMDFDGGNKTQLTSHRGVVISPDISFDGKKVLYSLIKEGRRADRNIDLYVMDLETKESKKVSSRPGINSGAIFLPDNQHIALTLSHEGNAEIYLMNLNDQSLKRITNHYSPDVDPSFNVSGDKMVFLSGRSGQPMIYMMDPRGLEKDVKRISFVGEFNATPRFSPDGKEIAFSSWLDNRFDIFRLDSEGNNLVRLTKDFGSNEDPTYSNDNQFLAFSSQRVLSRTKAVHNIYIMDREGEILGSITENFGNCITPRWSK